MAGAGRRRDCNAAPGGGSRRRRLRLRRDLWGGGKAEEKERGRESAEAEVVYDWRLPPTPCCVPLGAHTLRRQSAH